MKKIFKNLTFWIFTAAIIGYLLGKVMPMSFQKTQWFELILFLKSAFINLLKMMVAPLIFFSLLGGILNIGKITKLKRMGKVTIVYYLSTTIIAIMIGLVCVFFIHPWENGERKIKTPTQLNYMAPKKTVNKNADSIVGVIKKMTDKAFVNPIDALANNNILGIVLHALLFGLALLYLLKDTSPLPHMINDLNMAIGLILGWVIKLTPIGVFAIAFDFASKVSAALLGQVFSFCLLVFSATMIHGLIVLPLIAWLFGGVHPVDFFRKGIKPLIVAFTTSSSSATLPVTMKTCEEEFGVDKAVSGFVFPLGATMNMDGTALFEGIAAVFLAYLYNIELTTITTFSIFFMSMVSSIGAPGMPSASMAGMQVVLLAAGIPLEAIGILIVIDKPLDTFRTAVNVEGDMIGAIVTQKYAK